MVNKERGDCAIDGGISSTLYYFTLLWGEGEAVSRARARVWDYPQTLPSGVQDVLTEMLGSVWRNPPTEAVSLQRGREVER